MPARLPLPVISAGAVAVLAGLALGIGLGGTADHPRGGNGATDPSRGGDPGRTQGGGDLPPMDFEGKVSATSSRPSRASTTSTPTTTTEAPPSSEPQRAEEVTSSVGVTPTPGLPPLPAVPEVPASSLVETPSSSTPAST